MQERGTGKKSWHSRGRREPWHTAVVRGGNFNIYTKIISVCAIYLELSRRLYKGSYLNIRLNIDDVAGKPVRTLI